MKKLFKFFTWRPRDHKDPDLASVVSWRTFTSCEDLPLDKFIHVVCTGDHSVLVIAGNPPTSELRLAWNQIFFDYLDLSKANQTLYRLELMTEIAKLEIKKERVASIVTILRVMFHPELEKELQRMDFDIDLHVEDLDDYTQQLNGVEDAAKEINLDLKLKNLELAQLDEMESGDKGDQVKITPQYFKNILSKIATYKHVPVIRTSEITVAEFCAMFSEWLDYSNAVRKKLKKTSHAGV